MCGLAQELSRWCSASGRRSTRRRRVVENCAANCVRRLLILTRCYELHTAEVSSISDDCSSAVDSLMTTEFTVDWNGKMTGRQWWWPSTLNCPGRWMQLCDCAIETVTVSSGKIFFIAFLVVLWFLSLGFHLWGWLGVDGQTLSGLALQIARLVDFQLCLVLWYCQFHDVLHSSTSRLTPGTVHPVQHQWHN